MFNILPGIYFVLGILCPPRSILQPSRSCAVCWLQPSSNTFQFLVGFCQQKMTAEEMVEEGREVKEIISVLPACPRFGSNFLLYLRPQFLLRHCTTHGFSLDSGIVTFSCSFKPKDDNGFLLLTASTWEFIYSFCCC